MRPTYVSLSAVGLSPLIPIAYNALAPQVSAAVTLGYTSTTAPNLTYTVYHTFDDPNPDPNGTNQRLVSVSQTTTVITVTDNGPVQGSNPQLGHGLRVGDLVVLTGTQLPSGKTPIDGSYSVASITSATVYTLTSTVSQSATGGPNSQVQSFRLFTLSWFGLTGLTAATAAGYVSYPYPITGLCLGVSAYTAGVATLVVDQAVGS